MKRKAEREEIAKKSGKELAMSIIAKREEIMRLRLKQRGTAHVREQRKNLARLLTALNSKQEVAA
jgi:ribosomal protein L29